MKAPIGPMGKLDCLYSKKKSFQADKQLVLNRFWCWADIEPSYLVTDHLLVVGHNSLVTMYNYGKDDSASKLKFAKNFGSSVLCLHQIRI